MVHQLRSRTRPPSQARMTPFANLGRDLEIEARRIVAWLWGLLRMGLESMLRFGLRSDITATTLEWDPGHFPNAHSPRPEPHDSADRKPASSIPARTYAARRMPKKFLAARHGDE